MRIRSIKPEFWRSDDITTLDLADRLLFIGLWSYVDDNGVGRDSLAHIAADLFAADLERDSSETFARVSRGLSKLAERGLIVRYEGESTDDESIKRPLFAVAKWEKHQRIDKPGRARYTAPTREDVDSPTPRETVATPSREGRDIPAPGAVEQGSSGSGVGSRKRDDTTKRGSRINSDWMPSGDVWDSMRIERPEVDIKAEHRKFIDHWIAQPGQKGVKLDWDATFRNWIRNARVSQRPQLRAVVNDGRPEGW